MDKEFINLQGLTTFLGKLIDLFASAEEVAALEADTNTYVLSIDYDTHLKFDTSEIVTGEGV